MRYQYTPIRIVKIHLLLSVQHQMLAKLQSNSNPSSLLVRMHNGTAILERQFGRFFTKLKIFLPYNPVTVLLGVFIQMS